AAEVFSSGSAVDSRWYITSCSRTVNDVDHNYSDRTQGLFLASLEWNGGLPTVKRFDDAGRRTPDTLRRTVDTIARY
ncbi:MAG: hypothetical protein H7X80_02295, partial [bacterium]|nr:hypothetical protein [Candidatus Kapabacteria bacterium]